LKGRLAPGKSAPAFQSPMKYVFALILIAAGFAGGWHFYPDIQKDMRETIAERTKKREANEERIRNQTRQDDRKEHSRITDRLLADVTGNGGDTKGSEKVIPNPALNSGGNGKTSAPAVSVSTAPTAPRDEIEAKYPMPTFKTVEEITKDWTSIPSRAFPRPVTTKVAVTFDVGNGTVVVPEGTKVRALAMVGGLLMLAREGDENNRVQVPLANTDLKEFLTQKYEEWKNYRRDMVIKQRERARGLKEKANGADESQMAAAGPKPAVSPGGVIQIMLDDLQTRKLVELKASAITAWGDLNYEEVEGKTYWTGTVQCTVENALFGPQPTEVMALIKDNKVVKWMYTGSREEVQ
jgi:hypothetical protein